MRTLNSKVDKDFWQSENSPSAITTFFFLQWRLLLYQLSAAPLRLHFSPNQILFLLSYPPKQMYQSSSWERDSPHFSPQPRDFSLAQRRDWIISSTKGFDNPPWDLLRSIKGFEELSLRSASCVEKQGKRELSSLLIIKSCLTMNQK